jgi:hypothetical protein
VPYLLPLTVLTRFIYSNIGLVCKDKLVQLNMAIYDRAGNDNTHTAILQQHSADLSLINDDVKSIKDASLLMQGQFRDTMAPLARQLDQIPEMSAIQSENICVLLRALQDQMSGISSQISHQARMPLREPPGFDVPTLTDNTHDSENDDELLESIERLCQLAKDKGRTTSDDEAKSIIDDHHALLESAPVESLNCNSESHTSRKQPIGMFQQRGNDNDRELKRVRSLLTSSDSVMISQKGT